MEITDPHGSGKSLALSDPYMSFFPPICFQISSFSAVIVDSDLGKLRDKLVAGFRVDLAS